MFFDFDEALADWLDVADAGIKLLQGGQQTDRGGRFALILARGGNVNARRNGVECKHVTRKLDMGLRTI